MVQGSEFLQKLSASSDEKTENLANKIIADRIEKALGKKTPSKKIVFFVGAGVSIPAPSSMPDFNKLNLKVIKTVTNNKLNEEDYQLLSNNIRPEVMYQVAIDALGLEVLYSIEELEGHDPNYYHFFLAEAIKQGNWVFTTNTDNLIEIACEKKNVASKTYYGFSDDQDYKEYLSYINSGVDIPGGCIFKLHGSIERSKRGIEKYKTIKFSLRQVGEGLFGPRKEVLRYFLENFDFIFIGYRCRDDFSVFPVFEEINSSKDTYWFRYDNGPLAMSILESDRLKWEIEREENKPLDVDRDLDLLNLDKTLLTRDGLKLRFDGNLGKYIDKEMCPALQIDISHISPNNEKKNGNNFSNWATGKSEFDRFVFVGRLFEQIGQRDRAEQFYLKALEIAKDDSQHIIAKINLADLYYKESVPGKEKDTIALYEQCITFSRKTLEQCSLKVSISNIQRRRGKDYFPDSFEKIDEAKKEFELILDTEFEKKELASVISEENRANYLEYANCLNVYGLILYSLGNLSEARSSCLRSAEIKSFLGDINGIGESENAVSIICTQEGRNLISQVKIDEGIKRFCEAIEHAKKALDSRRKIGNFRGYAQNCRNLAWPFSELMKLSLDEYKRQKYFDEAKNGYKAGISAWNRIRSPPPGEIVLFSNLLAKLYIDFCSRTQDREKKEQRVKELAQEIIPRYKKMILDDVISRKMAKIDKRTPTAENNLREIKNLLEENGLHSDAEEAEKILNELAQSRE